MVNLGKQTVTEVDLVFEGSVDDPETKFNTVAKAVSSRRVVYCRDGRYFVNWLGHKKEIFNVSGRLIFVTVASCIRTVKGGPLAGIAHG